MKTLSCALLSTVLLATTDLAAQSTERRLVDRWVASWNSTDLNEVDSLFLDDQRLTYFSSEKEGVIQGMAALRAHHAGFGFVADGKVSPNKLWLDAVREDRLESGTSVFTAIWFFQRATDPTNPQRGPVTIVVTRSPGGPRIVHMHFANYPSAPAKP